MEKSLRNIALVGNPNSGKSSVFNLITGMHQKVGNFPGVTVEKKVGVKKLASGKSVKFIDLPGTYSLFASSADERTVVQVLTQTDNEDYPDAIIYVADCNNLERHLLLFTQIADLGFPLILVLTMDDLAASRGWKINSTILEQELHTKVVTVNGRTGKGIDNLLNFVTSEQFTTSVWYNATPMEDNIIASMEEVANVKSRYASLLWVHQYQKLNFLSHTSKSKIHDILRNNNYQPLHGQMEEIMERYKQLQPIVLKVLSRKFSSQQSLSDTIDTILTHNILGPLIFILLLVFVFNAIFSWSVAPMTWIDQGFMQLAAWIKSNAEDNFISHFIYEGFIPGLAGIAIFIPQIALLFLLISLLEEVGYMARAVYLFDHLLQRFGMNGRSLVSLISGGACAIPAIMSTRTISNWKERLITIFVTPFISCSARLPVYTILVAFVIQEDKRYYGIDKKALIFIMLYLLGAIMALLSAWVLNKILKNKDYSYLLMELPSYKIPSLYNIGINVWDKVTSFVFGAGKIIIIVSTILWLLSSYGPPKQMERAKERAYSESVANHLSAEDSELLSARYKMENSYAGVLGRAIEPAIAPLGFDWKIGIALVTSFAAREVFVSSMATLYSIGSSEDNNTINQKMSKLTNAHTGGKLFDRGTSLALMVFYLFALQCMSTLAVVRRETGTWRYPILQFVYMGAIAYIAAYIVQAIF